MIIPTISIVLVCIVCVSTDLIWNVQAEENILVHDHVRTKRQADKKARAQENMCRHKFEGFGVHLGAIEHLNKSTDAVISKVASMMYNDLGLRLFRTSYEEYFSPFPNMYDISCRNSFSCTWNKMHKVMSEYPDVKIFASIWSPPHYMKTSTFQLKSEYEDAYYYFVKNITALIQRKFNQTIELVSLVNEPENFVAPWDHTNMTPRQLCGMVERFKDPLVSACTENAWYSTTKLYMKYNVGGVNCDRACKIVLTHAYALNLNYSSPNFLLAYYDSTEHEETYLGRPVWQTEVSSTYGAAEQNQMLEAMDLAANIIQFVGTTCVTRYYFWSAFNIQPSGESLIWGNATTQLLTFPKKYYVYRHFTAAAQANPNTQVRRCDHLISDGLCLQFGDENAPAVFVNRQKKFSVALKANCTDLCCTSDFGDYFCDNENVVPAYSVCSCHFLEGSTNKEHQQRVEPMPLGTFLLKQFGSIFSLIG